MVVVIYILAINVIAVLSIIIISKNRYENLLSVHFFSSKSLDEFIMRVFKKRKKQENKVKNHTLNQKNRVKYCYLPINLKKTNINIELNNSSFALFPEKIIIDKFSFFCKRVGEIKFNKKEKFRAVKGKVLILEIAKSYVFLSLYDSGFDMVAHFKRLTHEYKFFKKEIRVLPVLVRYFFALEITKMRRRLNEIKNDILSTKNIKTLNVSKIKNAAVIYGLAKYNSLFTQYALKKNINVLEEIRNLSSELLEISSTLRACFLWLEKV